MIAPSTIVGGRYRVVRSLGGGGMKLVYLAEDLRLAARPCALAEMVDSFTSPDLQQQAVAAFQREADMLAQLANEHIPRIFDRFSEANHHYLVMEYIDGTTLEDELRAQGGKLPPAQVIEIALQILTTLEYLHNLDPPVIYRDLKPSNVMVTRGGMAKLIDFGIARLFAPLSNATMIGTQGYAPPEQYRGRVETRSDLYALGATMHHALSGRDPAAEAPFSFPSLRKLCPDLDPALAAVVDQALAYDVVNRMRDATEFKRRLIEIKNGASEPVKPASTPGNRSSARPQLPLPLGNASMAVGWRRRDAGQCGKSSGPLDARERFGRRRVRRVVARAYVPAAGSRERVEPDRAERQFRNQVSQLHADDSARLPLLLLLRRLAPFDGSFSARGGRRSRNRHTQRPPMESSNERRRSRSHARPDRRQTTASRPAASASDNRGDFRDLVPHQDVPAERNDPGRSQRRRKRIGRTARRHSAGGGCDSARRHR